MPETPRIIMDFVGGSEDDTRYDDSVPARVYYWSADHGRVGARLARDSYSALSGLGDFIRLRYPGR